MHTCIYTHYKIHVCIHLHIYTKSTHMYLYTVYTHYLCIYIYTYVYIYTRAYTYAYTFTHIYIYTHIRVYIYIHMCVCVYMCSDCLGPPALPRRSISWAPWGRPCPGSFGREARREPLRQLGLSSHELLEQRDLGFL